MVAVTPWSVARATARAAKGVQIWAADGHRTMPGGRNMAQLIPAANTVLCVSLHRSRWDHLAHRRVRGQVPTQNPVEIWRKARSPDSPEFWAEDDWDCRSDIHAGAPCRWDHSSPRSAPADPTCTKNLEPFVLLLRQRHGAPRRFRLHPSERSSDPRRHYSLGCPRLATE